VCKAARAGDWQTARKAHFALLDVHDAMFVEPNPAPIKAALAHLGRLQLALRLPMVPPSEQTRSRVIDAMVAFEREGGS
jgi:4-hydroxy-tetrahydrodipicolinate synthase